MRLQAKRAALEAHDGLDDVDDIENAERDRNANRYGGIETAKQDASTMNTLLTRALKQDLLEQYRLALMDKYDVHINDKLLAEMYTPKDDNAANGDE